MHRKVSTLIASRGELLAALSSPAFTSLGLGSAIGGNDANFVVVPILNRESGKPDNTRSQRIYKTLAEEEGVVVRYRGSEPGCEGCIRITVGTTEENAIVLKKLQELLAKF
jgi:histidinol-phosphate aminotransferase